MPSVAEAALEAWTDCQPEGYILDAQRMLDALPRTASRCLGARVAQLYPEFFAEGSSGEPSLFVRLLRPNGGRVHFLYFWKAFRDMARLAEHPCLASSEGVAAELETLRDAVLRRVEEERAIERGDSRRFRFQEALRRFEAAPPAIPAWALLEEVHRAAGMSAQPRFWQQAAASLDTSVLRELLSISELTSVLVVWLQDAALWELGSAAPGGVAFSSFSGISGIHSGHSARLNIYDASRDSLDVLFVQEAPSRLDEGFHVGLEVNGSEWSFGRQPGGRHGIHSYMPRAHGEHRFRQTVELKQTHLSEDAIANAISQLVDEYPGDGFDPYHRNCVHFADDLCARLGVGAVPAWVHHLALVTAQTEALLKTAQHVKETMPDVPGVTVSLCPTPPRSPKCFERIPWGGEEEGHSVCVDSEIGPLHSMAAVGIESANGIVVEEDPDMVWE